MHDTDLADLFRLEQILALCGERPTLEELGRLIADDFVEFGVSGKRWTKSSLIDAIQAWPQVDREVHEFSAKDLAEAIVLVTYTSTRKGDASDQAISRRSSIWRRKGTSWEIVFHHGTPLR
jgi:hypothetical protein